MLGSFEDCLQAGFLLFCASLHEGEHWLLALMVVGIQDTIGASTRANFTTSHGCSEWLVVMDEPPIEARTNFFHV